MTRNNLMIVAAVLRIMACAGSGVVSAGIALARTLRLHLTERSTYVGAENSSGQLELFTTRSE